MPDPRGFLEHERREPEKEPPETRVRHFHEFERSLSVVDAREQATRCMGCGVPFCHTGCPLGNAIPDWNELVRTDRFRDALVALEATNNFPEFTGRVCPAPCEAACVAGVHGEPVAIKAIERAISDRAAREGWLKPKPAERRTGKRVGVIGSGPAGLACAQELARAGHAVTVYEKDARPGGLLRYGIPDFKLEKALVDARIFQLRAEGVSFTTGMHVGVDVTLGELRARYDAVVVATGATLPRDLPIPGRDLGGVHFAMEYLVRQNRTLGGEPVRDPILATGKKVIVLGGGDTGSDCLGTALRQGAAEVVQIELLPRPPEERSPETPWPMWPLVYRTSTSQEEGGRREFAVLTKRFVEGEGGRVRGLELSRVEWSKGPDGKRAMREIEGSTFTLEADLVLLALGFVGPDPTTWQGGGLAMDERGNVRASATDFATGTHGVFACGDARRGQSLVVWAIWEGREAARAVDAYLMGETSIPTSPQAMVL
jgi:glutamate synthase (NADPH/NADH) small chain